MPVLADFTPIIGDRPAKITDVERDFKFNTEDSQGGTEVHKQAMIVFNIKGLKKTVDVKINGVKVGKLRAYPNTANFQKSWFTQTISMWGKRLKNSGMNELELEAIPGDPFYVKNVYCLFHQKS